MRTYGMIEPDCVMKVLTTGVDDINCKTHPHTSSNLVWELIDGINQTKDFGVKVSFNGVYIDYCGTKKPDNFGDFFCTLEQFNDVIENKYTHSWEDFCEFPSNDPKPANKTTIYILIVIVSFLLVAVVVLGAMVAKLNAAKNVSIPESSMELDHLTF
jgi:hypothetical protein